MKFPKDFVFGAATSAYQIEGDRKGRGDCIWDDFCERQGNVAFGHNGDAACGHVGLFREDVALMKQLGLDAYRFSVSWPRVMPDGIRLGKQGLGFYDRLVDELLANGIDPYLTLYHWDLPSALNARGGWQNPDIAKWFGDYARAVAEKLGDRVKHFMTLNEPQCFVSLGYDKGLHAPGCRLAEREILKVIHNVLLAHGHGVRAIRESVEDAQVGIAMVSNAHFPATDSQEDTEAAKKAVLSIYGNSDNWIYNVTHWCDPIYFGEYPAESRERFGENMPKLGAEDMKIISEPLDFHGENVYNGCAIAAGGEHGFHCVSFPMGFAKNSLGWAVTPESLNFPIRTICERYRKPIYITENGMCAHDWIAQDGGVHDGARVDFMNRYLEQLSLAVQGGADVRGYFAWSLMDNFEWAYGYHERFGIVYVDYSDGRRIPKDSALNYRRIISESKRDQK